MKEGNKQGIKKQVGMKKERKEQENEIKNGEMTQTRKEGKDEERYNERR